MNSLLVSIALFLLAGCSATVPITETHEEDTYTYPHEIVKCVLPTGETQSLLLKTCRESDGVLIPDPNLLDPSDLMKN